MVVIYLRHLISLWRRSLIVPHIWSLISWIGYSITLVINMLSLLIFLIDIVFLNVTKNIWLISLLSISCWSSSHNILLKIVRINCSRLCSRNIISSQKSIFILLIMRPYGVSILLLTLFWFLLISIYLDVVFASILDPCSSHCLTIHLLRA